MLVAAASRRLTGGGTLSVCQRSLRLSVDYFFKIGGGTERKSGMRNSRWEDEEVKTALQVY